MKKKIFYVYFAIGIINCTTALAFDLEDYALTYRATRDAYLKAANELKLATGPYKSAQKSYNEAVQTYVSTLNDGSPAVVKAKKAKASMACGIVYSGAADCITGQEQFKFDTEGDGNYVNDSRLTPADIGGCVPNDPSYVRPDYVVVEKATREAYLKAANEVIAVAYELKAAEDAYKKASQTYLKSTEIHDRYILQKNKVLQQK
jgi:hypothetical protein